MANTCFVGVAEVKGDSTERCTACGERILATAGKICPIARCSKRMHGQRAMRRFIGWEMRSK